MYKGYRKPEKRIDYNCVQCHPRAKITYTESVRQARGLSRNVARPDCLYRSSLAIPLVAQLHKRIHKVSIVCLPFSKNWAILFRPVSDTERHWASVKCPGIDRISHVCPYWTQTGLSLTRFDTIPTISPITIGAGPKPALVIIRKSTNCRLSSAIGRENEYHVQILGG